MTASVSEAAGLIDLVVDSSAVINVLLREPGWDRVLDRLCRAEAPGLAAPTRTEVLVVALVKLGDVGLEKARDFLDQQAILTLNWDQHLADGAARAYAQFGRGRHPSGLNFGDCFSYALAQHLQVPLLFVGNDFRRTDLIAAL